MRKLEVIIIEPEGIDPKITPARYGTQAFTDSKKAHDYLSVVGLNARITAWFIKYPETFYALALDDRELRKLAQFPERLRTFR